MSSPIQTSHGKMNIDFQMGIMNPYAVDKPHPSGDLAFSDYGLLPSPIDLRLSGSHYTPSDDCSSCCDKDNCSDQCDEENCDEEACAGCVDDFHPGQDSCTVAKCSAPACTAVPCTSTATCPSIWCDNPNGCGTGGLYATGCIDSFCRSDSCPETPCDSDVCAGLCTDSSCTGAYSRFPAGQHPYNQKDHRVSFHVKNASSNSWESPYHSQGPHVSNVQPGLLMSESPNIHCNNNIMSTARPRSSMLYHEDPQNVGSIGGAVFSSASAPKRRKLSSFGTISAPVYHARKQPAVLRSVAIIASPDNLSCLWDGGCEESFADSLSLADHIHDTHVDSQVDNVCLWDGCGTESEDPLALFNHITSSHTPSQPAQIDCLWADCDVVLVSKTAFKNHVGLHTSAGTQCQWGSCNHDSSDLGDHFSECHLASLLGSESKPEQMVDPIPAALITESIKCEWTHRDVRGMMSICGKLFESVNDLQQHAKDVHISALKKKTGYFCGWKGCNRGHKPFSQKGKVERHLQTHTGFKSCTCAVCNKEFSAPQALQQHMRIHTGEKPYKCDVCGKEFAQGSAMTMHKRVHTGERPLVCDFPGCGKRFSESSNLSKHRKTHNPTGQHRCGFPGCERSFHRLDQMKRHQKSHGTTDYVNETPSP